jgi:hypothetical protein
MLKNVNVRGTGGTLDPEKRRALTAFYREEFLRHLELLESNGIVNDGNREAVNKAYRRFLFDLDGVCCRSGFPEVAETLLQNFDALTRLSQLDPRRGH